VHARIETKFRGATYLHSFPIGGHSGFLSSLLFETSREDPATLGAAVVTLGLAAAAASYVPAWRASRVEPVESLRSRP